MNNMEESLSTLNFCKEAKNIKNTVRVNEESSYQNISDLLQFEKEKNIKLVQENVKLISHNRTLKAQINSLLGEIQNKNDITNNNLNAANIGLSSNVNNKNNFFTDKSSGAGKFCEKNNSNQMDIELNEERFNNYHYNNVNNFELEDCINNMNNKNPLYSTNDGKLGNLIGYNNGDINSYTELNTGARINIGHNNNLININNNNHKFNQNDSFKNEYNYTYDSIIKELNDAKETVEQKDFIILGLENQLEALRTTISELETDIRIFKHKIADDENKINELAEKIHHKGIDLTSTMFQNCELSKENREYEEKFLLKEKEISKVKEIYSNEINTLKAILDKKDETINKKNDEIDLQGKEILEKSQNMNELNQQITLKAHKIEELKADIVKLSQEKESLLLEIRNNENQIILKDCEIQKLQLDKDQIRETGIKLLKNYEEKYNLLEQDNSDKELQLNKCQSIIKENLHSQHALEQDIKKLEIQNRKDYEERTLIKRKLEVLEKNIKDKDQYIANLTEELAKVKDENEKLSNNRYYISNFFIRF